MPETLIVGAGPAGIAAAATLRRNGVSARILDAGGRVGGAYARLYADMPIVSPWPFNRLPYDKAIPPRPALTAGAYADYLRAYAEHHGVQPERAAVSAISRDSSGRFQVRAGAGVYDADHVIVATGHYDHPVRPSLPGNPSLRQIHSAEYRSAEDFRDQNVLLVGSGMSAFELGGRLMHAARRIDMSARRLRRPIPYQWLGIDVVYLLRPLEKLSRYTYKAFCGAHAIANDTALWPWIKNGRVRVFQEPERIEGREVSFRDGQAAAFDAVIWATGYEYQTPFLPDPVSASRQAVQHCESRVWPGLYFLGFPCARSTASTFLRGIAEDAVHIARRIAARREVPS